MENHLFEKLIRCHLEGRATPAQQLLIREALTQPEFQRIYFDVVHEWELANPQLLPDTNYEWEKLSTKIKSEAKSEADDAPSTYLRSRRNRTYLWIAAGLAIFVLMGVWKKDQLLFKQYETAFGETREITLPDGSVVTLNANSQLLYSRLSFFKEKREAILKGEAAFSVIHTKDRRPFIIHTPDSLQVKVLGTTFLVYSRQERSKVVLASGEIALSSFKTKSSPVLIKPGEVVDINEEGAFNIAPSKTPVEWHFSWKDNQFFFDQTPLEEISKQVSERFGVQIVIPDSSLAKTPISGNYPAQSAEEVVSMLSTILNLKHSRLNQTSILLQKSNLNH